MGSKLTQGIISNSNISLSEIGLGTVKFGRNTDIKYPKSFNLPSDDDILEILNTAADLGINYLDTAIAYGSANRRLGQLLPKINTKFKIVAKIGEHYSIENGSKYNFSRSALENDYEKLLKELGINFIECLLLHCNNNDSGNHIREGLVFLSDMKKAGFIGAFGSSCKTKDGVKLALDLGSDLVMIEPNLYMETKELFNLYENVSVLIKKVFSSGNTLLNKNSNPSDILKRYTNEESINSIVIGSINISHIRQNIEPLLNK
tara:strand:- start:2471 stop:3253 length:783 start_codon:yes stop_codon:yes gene_type:complete